ncbi:MAG: ABC transporter permease [Chloroflexi bacterium]|nr:ABC transporter permease [Chloroflexota bacterium]MCY3582166.1 ABC transporter permease [Chloroflexota bacterium]MCY3715159.1 ABC transporter permease [Chloroflexota bacterium]MDE2649930.1 ABC transporter permease [Chloroflexota bacterium]
MNKDKAAPTPRRPLDFLGIALAVVIIGTYFLLPFVIQPERGPSTVAVLTESKKANELGIFKTGIEIVPLAALGMLLLGAWNALVPGAARAISLLLALAGLVALVYYINFFRDYAAEQADFISQMGIAFWIMLGASAVAVLQVLIPRAVPTPRYRPAKLFGNQESVILFGLLLLVIVVGLANPRYLQERNISDNLAGNAYIAVAALGMTMVIVTGNIDISVGSLVGLLAVASGRLVVAGLPAPLAWLTPLVVGAGFGALIGFLVAYMRIPSIVVTLGMLSIIKGILIIWVQGERVTDMPADYFLSQMRPLGIPMPIIIMVLLTIGVALWMRYSATGRAFYALGGNAEAARLSGLSRRRLVMTVFILNGVFVGVASVMYSTQFNIIQATPPPALELSVITASVVGGVSILGGTGTAIGSTMATLLLNFIRSAMIFINISPFWLKAVQGLLILVTVLADLLRRRRQRL